MIYEYVLVFLGAAIPWLEIGLVVPVGIVAGLSPVWVMIVAFTGNLSTIIALIIGFEKVKVWYLKRQKRKKRPSSKRSERAKRSWRKYGIPGLAFLGPILTGTHIAVFIGLLLGAPKKPMLIWMTISIALWVLIFGIVTALGFDFFTKNI